MKSLQDNGLLEGIEPVFMWIFSSFLHSSAKAGMTDASKHSLTATGGDPEETGGKGTPSERAEVASELRHVARLLSETPGPCPPLPIPAARAPEDGQKRKRPFTPQTGHVVSFSVPPAAGGRGEWDGPVTSGPQCPEELECRGKGPVYFGSGGTMSADGL